MATKDESNTKTPPVDKRRERAATPVDELEYGRCLVCDTVFSYTRAQIGKLPTKYCSYDCKEKAKTIRQRMKYNNLDPDDLSLFLVERRSHNPTPPLHISKYGVVTPADRKRAIAAKETAKAATARAAAKRSKQMAETEAMKLKRLRMENESQEKVKQVAKAVNLLPLSEAADILSGKATFMAEHDIARARTAINHVVSQQLLLVDKVMSGEITWTTTQANLFKTLLNKVVPDAASQRLKSSDKTSIEDMTVDELEALIARHTDQAKVVATQPEQDIEDAED